MHKYLYFFLFLIITSLCACTSKKEKAARLYAQNCASCHIAPDINSVPKEFWKKEILQDMAARLGIKENNYVPYEGRSFTEQNAIISTGVYPSKPMISLKDWHAIRDYILNEAPDSLSKIEKTAVAPLMQFQSSTITIDSTPGGNITFLDFSEKDSTLYLGDLYGRLRSYSFIDSTLSSPQKFSNTISSYKKGKESDYLTLMGSLRPSDIPSGTLLSLKGNVATPIKSNLQRPTHLLVEDLNEDGIDEIIVSEFGNLRGQLTLLSKPSLTAEYLDHVLLPQAGVIQVIAKDMNKDHKKDLVVLTTQGDESITILYQQENLNFKIDKAIRFSPVYGSSWFQLIDYDFDGDLDIITVQGDNADMSMTLKPYHGMRIYLNDGTNTFDEAYFYPMYGATRLIAQDFDKDKDIDFAILSTFPDYTDPDIRSFVYLENKSAKDFTFTTHTGPDLKIGKWFLMDKGDVDTDGDEDIILSSFTYPYTPAPKELQEYWNEQNVDILILKNSLYE